MTAEERKETRMSKAKRRQAERGGDKREKGSEAEGGRGWGEEDIEAILVVRYVIYSGYLVDSQISHTSALFHATQLRYEYDSHSNTFQNVRG